ncbi:MAG: restriction endonuclease subunit S [Nitrosomonas sp.]|nr:restriction endonuclease subunit S [Nitrosomonas sp.]MCW5607306.1 restriction endonuclease subunit S [Nitrosomonas sp.]
MVPKGWKEQSINELLEKVSNPVTVSPEKVYREIGIRSHSKGIFHKEPITGKAIGSKRVFHIEPNCLIINIVFAWEQAVAKTSDKEIGMIASHRFPMYKPKKERCDIDYILYLFKAKRGKHLLELASPGGAGRNKTLGQSEFSKLQLIVPPVLEQKKIAQILSTWDKAITTTEKLLANSQQQKKALMQQLLTGKKRLLGDDGVRFSEEWRTAVLGEIGEIKSAGVDKKIVEGEKPVRLLNFTDVFKRSFIYSNELNHWVTAPDSKVFGCNVLRGDVFFTPSSETRDEIGMSAVAAEDIPDCCYSYHVVRFRINEDWDLNFRAFAFTTGAFRKQIALFADGSGQRYVVSQDGFRSILVSYPEFEEQRAIGRVLRLAEEEVTALQNKLDTLKQEKKSLMQQLLTGKCRVKIEETA